MVKRIFNRRAWQEILFILSLTGHYMVCTPTGLYSDYLWD
jgi:hypothetical protein